LIGNKADLKDARVVTREDAKRCVATNGIDEYFECSAKDLTGVKEAFEYIIIKAFDFQPNIQLRQSKIGIEKKKEKKKCCG